MPDKRHIDDNWAIGPVKLSNRLLQAPMAGISGRAFRLQARRFGAAMTATEMISSYGLHYRNRRTLEMLEMVAGEHPVSVQLFGNRPDIMAEAASAAEAAEADIIDINMGCPVRKVTRTGAGVALMDAEGPAAGIVAAVVSAVSLPVTVKIRSGRGRAVTAAGFAVRMEDAGAAAVIIHPRLGVQDQKGRADHAVTAAVAEALAVPVIASGDVDGPAVADQLLKQAGCAAVMMGRACLGNPWLYEDIRAGREPGTRPLSVILEEMGRFYRDLQDELGGERAVRVMRKFYGWYLKPFRPEPELRAGLRRAASFGEALRLIRLGLDHPGIDV